MELIYQQQQFDDFDAYCHGARHWDIDFMQLDRGRFIGNMLQILTPDFQLGYTTINRQLKQQGSAPPGMRTFAIPAHSGVRLIWKGTEIPNDAIMIFQPDYGLDAVSFSDFNMFTFSITPGRLRQLSFAMGYMGLERKVDNADIIICDTQLMNVLRATLRQVCSAFATGRADQANDSQNDRLNREIPRLLLMNLGFGRIFNISQRRRVRDEAVRQVEMFIETNEFSQEPLTVAKLCQAANVSPRTLEYAFREHVGLTPKQYLKAYRLNRVREALRLADPLKAHINQLANRWGFWHMGQFAADYRRLFSELPSETLNNPFQQDLLAQKP